MTERSFELVAQLIILASRRMALVEADMECLKTLVGELEALVEELKGKVNNVRIANAGSVRSDGVPS